MITSIEWGSDSDVDAVVSNPNDTPRNDSDIESQQAQAIYESRKNENDAARDISYEETGKLIFRDDVDDPLDICIDTFYCIIS